MSNIIKIKRSNTKGRIPDPANLDIGEIAVNIADRRIYTKESGGNVIHLFPPNVLINGYKEQGVSLGKPQDKTINIDGRLYEFNTSLSRNVTITVGNKPTPPVCGSIVIYAVPAGYEVKFVGVDYWAGGRKPTGSTYGTIMRYVLTTTPRGKVMADGEAFD
jgi:hypothetical protein